MKKVNISEILDYDFCPMLYKYKYIDKLSDSKINIEKEYNDAIKKSIYGFLASNQKNDVNFTVLKNIWGRIWIKQKKTIELIYQKPKTWRDSHNEKRKLGIMALKNFYDFCKKYQAYPIIFNKSYSLKIDNDIVLNGDFEVVREFNNSIQILCVISSSKSFNQINVEKDLEVSAIVFAFRQAFSLKEQDIILFNSEKGTFKYTFRSDNDYEVLKDTVKKIVFCINNEVFYICPSNKCYNCSYKNICVNKLS